jgi:hypothetical protein
VCGFTVGVENWLSSHGFVGPGPAQNEAEPLIGRCGDHERPWSSEWLSMITEAAANFVHMT